MNTNKGRFIGNLGGLSNIGDPDLLLPIFSFLTTKEKSAARLVSATFNDYFLHPALWSAANQDAMSYLSMYGFPISTQSNTYLAYKENIGHLNAIAKSLLISLGGETRLIRSVTQDNKYQMIQLDVFEKLTDSEIVIMLLNMFNHLEENKNGKRIRNRLYSKDLMQRLILELKILFLSDFIIKYYFDKHMNLNEQRMLIMFELTHLEVFQSVLAKFPPTPESNQYSEIVKRFIEIGDKAMFGLLFKFYFSELHVEISLSNNRNINFYFDLFELLYVIGNEETVEDVCRHGDVKDLSIKLTNLILMNTLTTEDNSLYNLYKLHYEQMLDKRLTLFSSEKDKNKFMNSIYHNLFYQDELFLNNAKNVENNLAPQLKPIIKHGFNVLEGLNSRVYDLAGFKARLGESNYLWFMEYLTKLHEQYKPCIQPDYTSFYDTDDEENEHELPRPAIT